MINNKMKILIIGGSGVIGGHLFEFLKREQCNVEYTFKANNEPYKNGYFLDITDQDETSKTISKINPDLVIHAAALANVDQCQLDKKLANKINIDGTKNVIESCQYTKSKIIYISTSFVFEGSNKKYNEKDNPINPGTHYGLTKLNGEKLVLKSKLKSLILRIDQPYGWKQPWHHTNSVLRVIEALSKKQEFRDITDWFNVPTYIPDLSKAAFALINNDEQGIFHLTGSDFINRFDWALKTAEIFGLNKNLLVPISSKQLDIKIARDSINLDNKKIYEKTGIRMKGIEEGLKDMLLNKPML
jgi:dTDP-4-dehydrorhamnose reductase